MEKYRDVKVVSSASCEAQAVHDGFLDIAVLNVPVDPP